MTSIEQKAMQNLVFKNFKPKNGRELKEKLNKEISEIEEIEDKFNYLFWLHNRNIFRNSAG